ncbi:MAG: TonB-dependent receptor [Colwellia sp.]|nr:TonB-dependent receptor [Colwellia sp.]MCW9079922.1 TonB-dependent receptor [Colwellia sp.]
MLKREIDVGIHTKKVIKMLPLSLAIATYTGSVQAEEVGKEDEAKGIEVITVTSQKRVEPLQDVPISIGAITGKDIEQAELSNFMDVAELLPGLTFSDRNDPRTTSLAIRGVGTIQVNISSEPSAAIIIDGEVMARSSAIHSLLGDNQRVELLKGPQGTLFGKNTSAGALHVISNRPNFNGDSGKLKAGFAEAADGFDYTLQGTFNKVLSDSTAVRLNLAHKYKDGHIENVIDGQDHGGSGDDSAGKVQVLHYFDDDTSLLWRLDHTKSNYGPGNRVYIRHDRPILSDEQLNDPRYLEGGLVEMVDGVPVANSRAHILSQTPEGEYNDKTSYHGSHDPGELKNTGTSLELNWAMGDYDMVYAGYYRDFDMYSNETAASIAINTSPYTWAGKTRSQTVQHEFRIASPESEDYEYILGAAYFSNDTERRQQALFCNDPGLQLSQINLDTFNVEFCGEQREVPFNMTDFNPTTTTWGSKMQTVRYTPEDVTLETENFAIFGSIDFHLTEKLTATVGARVLREEQEYTDWLPVIFDGATDPETGELINKRNFDMPGTDFERLHNTHAENKVLGRAAIKYYPIEEVMTYASIATGYKGVAWWSPDTVLDNDDFVAAGPIEGEDSINYEIGVRSDWLDNTLRLNASIFYAEYENYQDRIRSISYDTTRGASEVTDPITGETEIRPVYIRELMNAGTLISKGVDFDFIYQPIEHLEFSGNLNYLDAYFGESDAVLNCPPHLKGTDECYDILTTRSATNPKPKKRSVYDLEGDRLAGSPEWQGNLNIKYDHDFLGGNGYVKLNYRYKGDESPEHGALALPEVNLDARGIYNLFFGWNSNDNDYSVSFYVKNIFDKHYYSRKSTYGDSMLDRAVGSSAYYTDPITGGADSYTSETYGLGRGVDKGSTLAGNVPRDFNRYFGATVTVRF